MHVWPPTRPTSRAMEGAFFCVRSSPPPPQFSSHLPPAHTPRLMSNDRRASHAVLDRVTNTPGARVRCSVLETIDCPDDDGSEGRETADATGDARSVGRVWIMARYTDALGNKVRVDIAVVRTAAARSVSPRDEIVICQHTAFWTARAGVVVDYPLERVGNPGANGRTRALVGPIVRVKP